MRSKPHSRRGPDAVPAAPYLSGSGRGSSRPWLAVLAIVAVTLLAYQKVWHAGFIWDDDAHLIRPELTSLHGLGRIWAEPGATQQYYPVLSSAFWAEEHLWGYSPLGYHLTNLLFHGTAASLLFLLLRRLRVPGAFLAAVLFALHPVCVESVAWISEEKNTLSAAFYLCAALAYVRFYAERQASTYALATGLFALALLTKSVTATLPASLLIVFWWKRGRLSWKTDLAPLVPWLGMSAAAGTMTVWVEHHFVGAGAPDFTLSPVGRGLVAGRALWFYLGKMLWPSGLMFIYPRWTIDVGDPVQYLFPVGVVAVLGLLFALRRRSRAPLAFALLYIVTLSPALGFVDVYPFRFSYVADHFQYLGAAVLLSAAAAVFSLSTGPLARKSRTFLVVLAVAAAGFGARLAFLVEKQCLIYQNGETLWRATIAQNPDSWMAYNNLGLALVDDGRVDEAIACYRNALRVRPAFAAAHTNLGIALLAQQHPEEAANEFRRALAIDPNDLETHNSLGIALRQEGRMDEALEEYRTALKLRADDSATNFNLANALLQAGRVEEAIGQYQRTLKLGQDFADAHNNLGNAFWRAGRIKEAIAEYRRALELEPEHARARANLDKILAGEGH
jgi:protein O-mannosyl-transferase